MFILIRWRVWKVASRVLPQLRTRAACQAAGVRAWAAASIRRSSWPGRAGQLPGMGGWRCWQLEPSCQNHRTPAGPILPSFARHGTPPAVRVAVLNPQPGQCGEANARVNEGCRDCLVPAVLECFSVERMHQPPCGALLDYRDGRLRNLRVGSPVEQVRRHAFDAGQGGEEDLDAAVSPGGACVRQTHSARGGRLHTPGPVDRGPGSSPRVR